MASSLASTAPFGCVLRDHNRSDRRRDHTNAGFDKDLKHLVRDCISLSSDENSENWFAAGTDRSGGGGNRHRHKKTQKRGSHDSSSGLSHRQARVLDLWAAKQAREIVSTIEKEAEIFSPSVLSSCATAPGSETAASSISIESSPPPVSEGSFNRGASSLVQIWEARLSHRRPLCPNPNLTVCTNRTVSGGFETHSPLEPSTASYLSSSPVLDSFVDSEPDKTTTKSHHAQADQRRRKQPTSAKTQNLDEGDKERMVRVVDIIRRLTDPDHEPSARESSPCSSVVSSPRPIRGRQAFTDMLMNMERNRRAELSTLGDRHVVSRFPQRGRIQSMLKLRALQRNKIGHDQSRSSSPGKRILPPCSSPTIRHLRERFNAGVNKKTTPSDNVNQKGSGKAHVKDAQTTSNSSSTIQTKEGSRCQEANASEQPSTSSGQHSVSQRTEDHREEASLRLDDTRPGTKTHPSISKLQDIVASSVHSVSQRTEDLPEEARLRLDLIRQAKTKTEPIIPNAQETVTSSVQHSVSQRAEDRHEEATVTWQGTSSEPSQPNLLETETITLSVQHSVLQRTEDVKAIIPVIQEISDPSASVNNDGYESEMVEEQELYDQQQTGANLDWIDDISRPRSYWEDRRRAWYEEMLNNNSENEDIRRLIERKTVSSFLGSGFRERMDRLMQSHYEIQSNEEDLDEDTSPLTMEKIMLSYLQKNAHQESSDGGEETQEQEIEEDEEEEENSALSLQSSSPSILRAWSYQDNDSDQVASTAFHLPSQSPTFYQGSHHHFSPSRNNSSIEMELIYDLRFHMEQMHREMSELRSTVKSCVDMQLKLQSSIKQEFYSALEEGKRSSDKSQRKGTCRVCKENKVDSLLYRCGHMCTCFKCAQGLRRSSGKCPVCQAPIDDVVQAFPDS